MKIHYFQRYHKGEDVATANTMLLLSRLYAYSPNKFFQFLKEQFFGDIVFEPELSFVLQDKSEESVPDATITQPSFKLVVETKLIDTFYQDQLIRHLSKFKNEEYKVLITLSSELMEQKKKELVDKAIVEYNEKHKTHIIHVNTTFKFLAQGVQDVITERDYEMQDVLDDYLDYCHNDKLIVIPDAWKKMRMQLAGTTFDFNVSENVYYDNVERGELTEERKQTIARAIEDGKKYEYVLDAHRYFFVDKFYETDFPKVTPRAPMGSRMFDLTEVLGVQDLPDTEKIAMLLKEKSWN